MTKDLTRQQSGQSDQETDGSLSDRIRQAVRKTVGTAAPTDACLVLDTSRSMNTHIGANRRSIDELRTLAAGFLDIRRVQFGSVAKELKPDQEPGGPAGGTAMDLAFKLVKQLGLKHAIVITDGEPDDEDRTLWAAQGLKIDAFYVGPDGNQRAQEFLRKLCGLHGGQYGKASLEFAKELTGKVRALLGPGSPKKGAIEL
jgi:hypothetical protein